MVGTGGSDPPSTPTRLPYEAPPPEVHPTPESPPQPQQAEAPAGVGAAGGSSGAGAEPEWRRVELELDMAMSDFQIDHAALAALSPRSRQAWLSANSPARGGCGDETSYASAAGSPGSAVAADSGETRGFAILSVSPLREAAGEPMAGWHHRRRPGVEEAAAAEVAEIPAAEAEPVRHGGEDRSFTDVLGLLPAASAEEQLPPWKPQPPTAEELAAAEAAMHFSRRREKTAGEQAEEEHALHFSWRRRPTAEELAADGFSRRLPLDCVPGAATARSTTAQAAGSKKDVKLPKNERPPLGTTAASKATASKVTTGSQVVAGSKPKTKKQREMEQDMEHRRRRRKHDQGLEEAGTNVVTGAAKFEDTGGQWRRVTTARPAREDGRLSLAARALHVQPRGRPAAAAKQAEQVPGQGCGASSGSSGGTEAAATPISRQGVPPKEPTPHSPGLHGWVAAGVTEQLRAAERLESSKAVAGQPPPEEQHDEQHDEQREQPGSPAAHRVSLALLKGHRVSPTASPSRPQSAAEQPAAVPASPLKSPTGLRSRRRLAAAKAATAEKSTEATRRSVERRRLLREINRPKGRLSGAAVRQFGSLPLRSSRELLQLEAEEGVAPFTTDELGELSDGLEGEAAACEWPREPYSAFRWFCKNRPLVRFVRSLRRCAPQSSPASTSRPSRCGRSSGAGRRCGGKAERSSGCSNTWRLPLGH